MKIKWFELISNKFLKKKESEEDIFFKEQFDSYLKMEDCVFCYQMIEEGYQPSFIIKKKLDDILINKIEKSQYDYSEILKMKAIDSKTKIMGLMILLAKNEYDECAWTAKKEVPYQNLVLEVFEDNKNKEAFNSCILGYVNVIGNYYCNGLDEWGIFSQRTDKENLYAKSKYKAFMYITHILLQNDILKIEEIQLIKEAFKNLNQLIKNRTRDVIEQSFSRIGKENMEPFIDNLTYYQDKLLIKDSKKENVLKQLRSSNSRKKTLDEEIKELIIKEEVFIENLPKQEKEQVERITSLVNSVNNKEVSDFVQERLPIILKKYFSIDEEYRTSLKNVEGYNAQQLMSLSLENIERIIVAKKEDNNYDLLSELSIENRKLKVRI